MHFLSVKEFFYKVNTIGFILLLLPLVVFIFLYYRSIDVETIVADESQTFMLLAIFTGIFIADLTIVHWVWSYRLGKMKLMPELAA